MAGRAPTEDNLLVYYLPTPRSGRARSRAWWRWGTGRPYDGVKVGDHAGIQPAFRFSPPEVDSYAGLLARRVEVLGPPPVRE